MIYNDKAGAAVYSLITTIQNNKDFLSEIDGRIGDGDHGINMNKGFSMCREKLEGKAFSLSGGLSLLAETLLEDIGGSMGPLYGVLFEEMAMEAEDIITPEVFGRMIRSGIEGVMEIGSAKRGDKTLLDTLIPAMEAYEKALEEDKDFTSALEELKKAAKEGWRSTEGMMARIGRASRLGERSIGVLDAGATSAYFLIVSLAEAMQKIYSCEK